MNSLQLTPLNDNFSTLLSRLDRIESSLKGLDDVLKEIEVNTRPEDNNSCSRETNEADKTEKVTVEIRTSIISVGDIDTVAQQFKCDFYLSATWQEPRLQERIGKQKIDWKNEWHPRIVFFNAIEIEKMEKNHFFFSEEGFDVPFAKITYRLKGSFRQNLVLWSFPMDYQELTITLMSDWTNKMVEFKKNMRKKDTIRTETFTAVQEWSLCKNVVTESKSTEKTKGSSENEYPLYHIKCHVKRKNGYYLWNIGMIMFSINILSFCSFSVDISSPSDRLSVTLTLLLTAVAFKFVVSQSLPTISYLTLLDKYVLSGLVFLCFIALENAIAAIIPGSEAQKYFDRICLYLGIVFFGAVHVWAIVKLIIEAKARKRVLKENKRLYKVTEGEVSKFCDALKQKIKSAQSLNRPMAPSGFLSQDGIQGNHASPSPSILSGKSYV